MGILSATDRAGRRLLGGSQSAYSRVRVLWSCIIRRLWAHGPQLEVNKITGMMESSSDNETVPQTDSDRHWHAHGDSDRDSDSDSGVQVQVELQVLNDSESDHSHWEP